MTPLRTLTRDLVERRLWPVAAVLVVGLIALPLLFLRPAPAALAPSSAAPAAPASAPATTAPAATTSTASTGTGADPGVALTSSPFAAAFGSGLSLPPSMQGLLKQTKGADARKEVADAPLRDPFASSSSATKSTSAAAPAAAPAPAPAAPAPAASSASSSASSPSTPAPAPGPAPEVAPASVPEPAPAPAAPSGDSSNDSSAGASAAASTTIYHADVRFGTATTNPMVSDAKRLTAFPDALDPIAVYLGVMRGGWGAAFALREGTQPLGAPSCRPRRQICTWVILHPGETLTLSVTDPVTGVATPYQLKLEKVRATTVTPKAALAAGRRVASDGRCQLGPLAAYRYDSTSGTLAPRPELKSCRYGTPVHIAHIG